jgi:hypothetical protein
VKASSLSPFDAAELLLNAVHQVLCSTANLSVPAPINHVRWIKENGRGARPVISGQILPLIRASLAAP